VIYFKKHSVSLCSLVVTDTYRKEKELINTYLLRARLSYHSQTSTQSGFFLA